MTIDIHNQIKDKYYHELMEKLPKEEMKILSKTYIDNSPSSYTKYLQYKGELRRMLILAIDMLHLDSVPPCSMLDIGCGASWFSYIAKHFGHDIHMADCPSQEVLALQVYNKVIEILGMKKDFEFAVRTNETMPNYVGRYDIVSALGMCFHNGWRINEWMFFLNDIIENHLTPGVGKQILFQMNVGGDAGTAVLAMEKEKVNIIRAIPKITEWDAPNISIARIGINNS